MKTTSEKMENCQVALTVEMENSETEKYIALGLDHIAKQVTLPGFRKGKAPKPMVEQHVGKQAILQEAIEHMMPEAYAEALKLESINAIAEPHIELIGVEPVKFKAIVPTKPDVTPGNYRDIKIEMEKKEITDNDIDQVIEQLRLQFGSLVPVDRAVKLGDVITVDIRGKRNSEQILDRKDANYEVRQESKYPVPGFAEKLIDMNKTDEKEFTISFVEDYEIKEIAGKEYSFSVKVNEIKEMNLPEVNDDFAKNAGAENVEELRIKIKEGMQIRAEESMKKEFDNKLVRAIIDSSKIDFPPVLVEKEIDHLIDEEARNFPEGIKGLENYLAASKKTLEQHREDLRPSASDRVKAYLVTRKIGEMENITVTDEQVNDLIENMIKGDESRAENVRALFNMPEPRESLKEMMVINKTMDLLTGIATGKDKQESASGG